MRIVRVLVAAAAAAIALPLGAQTSPLAGTWQVEYQRGLRHENGEITPIMGTATLALAQRGDSLVGQFVPAPGDDGRTPRSLIFAAASTGASATFITKSEARVNMNGEEQTVAVTITWNLAASGDALTGTMQRTMAGFDMPTEPAPLTGTRVR
jgi:hypothetical protein